MIFKKKIKAIFDESNKYFNPPPLIWNLSGKLWNENQRSYVQDIDKISTSINIFTIDQKVWVDACVENPLSKSQY